MKLTEQGIYFEAQLIRVMMIIVHVLLYLYFALNSISIFPFYI